VPSTPIEVLGFADVPAAGDTFTVVEDERKVAKALEQGLEAEHYEVAVAHTGEDGFYLISTQAFDMVLLDLT